MSLQIWLPLIDNLDNKGVSTVKASVNNSNIAPAAGGKLGATAYSFNSVKTYAITIPYSFNTTTSYSICLWFKTPTISSTTQWLYNTNTGTGTAAQTHMGTYINNTSIIVRSGGMANNTISYNLSTNTWYHFVQCLDVINNKVYIYLNGTLLKSYNYTGSGVTTSRLSIGARYTDTSTWDYGLLGQVNDFRVYDHALSAVEVKELARGLTLHYKLNGNYELEQSLNIPDSSGYERHGTMIGARETANASARYAQCEYITLGTTQYIQTPTLTFDPKEVTLNIWFKSSSKTPTGNYHMVVDSVANRQAYEMCVYKSGYFRAGLLVNGTRYAANCSDNTTVLNGNWHMLTLTYDGETIKRYVDSVLESTSTVSFSTGLTATTALTIGRDGPSASYACKEASLNDFRIYVTALSLEDIQQLYQTSVKIGNLGDVHPYEIVEGEDNKILKNGQLIATNVVEYNYMSYLKYDPNLYFEPDGSVWVHMYHHDAPYTNGVFTNPDGSKCSDAQFEQSIYLDEYRWFNVELCNYVNKWEIITKRRATNSGDFVVNRWIQPVNPMTASSADVPKTSLIQPGGNTYMKGAISTYNNYSNNYCGYAHFNSSDVAFSQAYLCASGSSGTSWYGAIGAKQYWSTSRKDTTSFNTTSTASGISTGSVDLYLRIDNVEWTSPTNAKTTENKLWVAPEFIER